MLKFVVVIGLIALCFQALFSSMESCYEIQYHPIFHTIEERISQAKNEKSVILTQKEWNDALKTSCQDKNQSLNYLKHTYKVKTNKNGDFVIQW